MACIACLLYAIFFIAVALLILKLYILLTTGKYEIKESLKGKVVLITGGTAGIGKETVREFAKNGATVHVLARNLQKADKVVGEIKESTGSNDIHIHHVDLSDFSTVRTFGKNFLATQSPIHILINNAGLMNPTKKYTVDGNEDTTQANHLSHFLLTNLLLDRIKESAPSRIVSVSSNGHLWSNETFNPHDLNYNSKSVKWTSSVSYCHSKLMNVLFTRELAKRLYGTGVNSYVVHPGVVRTEFADNFKIDWSDPLTIVFGLLRRPMRLFIKNEREGAATTLYVALSDQLNHISGHYFADCKLDVISLAAANDQLAKELWEESEKLTGLVKS